MDYYRLGQQIRKYRKINNMSQEQLAEKAGISVTHMSHIETGNTKLSLQVLVDISEALEVSVDDLLSTSTHPREQRYQDIMSVMDTCSPQQIKIITDIIKSVKNTLDKYI